MRQRRQMSVRHMSDNRQISVRLPFNCRGGSSGGGGGGLVEEEEANVRQLSGNCPATVRQLSGCPRTVVDSECALKI